MHGIHGDSMSGVRAHVTMLALSRHLPQAVRNQDQHKWDRQRTRILRGKTVRIFGVGAIGEALAPRCKAMGMTVVGIDPVVRSIPAIDRWYGWSDLPKVMGELDYVVLFLPSTAKTRGIFGESVIAAMKPTSYLINLGRGPP